MKPIRVGAYYFPNYHVDARNEQVHGQNWTEWELVKCARPRWENHQQPKVPLWGYEDEADPIAMARKIDAAADHGVDHFLFDWYFYDDGPFLNRALDEGFLGAPNRERIDFALMWANHNWKDIHPAPLHGHKPLLYPGAVSRETFERIGDLIIEKYFSQPNYLKIDGCPYFSIYELMPLIEGLGGVSETRKALDEFRAKTKRAGFPDLHLNAIVWGVKILPDEQAIPDPNAMLAALNFDSIASYVWVHHVGMPDFPETSYQKVMTQAQAHWRRARDEFELPFFPNVTMGWDSSARTIASDTYTNVGYPFMATMSENTPAAFKTALQSVKAFVDERPGETHLVSINAWNEWTEGSYLEPDTLNGYGYLEAIRDVFVDKQKS